MSKPLVSDQLWEIIEPLLPLELPKPKGGRPRVPDRAALAGIIFVLRSGLPWEIGRCYPKRWVVAVELRAGADCATGRKPVCGASCIEHCSTAWEKRTR